MNFLSKILDPSKSAKNCAVALDIGTETVKALVFKIDLKEERGVVVGVGKEHHKTGNFQSGMLVDIDGVVAACREAIEKASRTAKLNPKKVIVSAGGEFIKGKTTTVAYERAKPEMKVSPAELKNIIHKVQWKAFDMIKRELARETGNRMAEIKLINAAILGIKIDGYPVSNPLGFQGKDISISIFNTYALLIHMGALQSVIDNLGLDLLDIVAEPRAIAKAVGKREGSDSDVILINVGGETTDIILACNGNIEETRTFSLGGKAFTERLAQELGISPQKAEEIKIDYSQSRLNKELSGKIEKVFSADGDVWLSGVELSLNEFSEIDLLPSKILLSGGGSILPGLKKALGKTSWTKNLPFARKPKVSFALPSEVVNILDETGELDSPQDITAMGLVSIALDLAKKEESLSKILKRVTRMVQS